MLERLHRTLKSSLMAQDNQEHWADNLPLVLLGIRATLKPDVDSCPGESVYGATLRLPAEFVNPREAYLSLFISDVLQRLRSSAWSVRPKETRPQKSGSQVSPQLQKSTHVFLRCDGVRCSFEPPYDGSFPVLSR